MSFTRAEECASKTASLPAPQIHPQTQPAKSNLFTSPALGNPFHDYQKTTPRTSLNANHGQFAPQSDAAYGSPLTQPSTYQNYQISSPRSADRYSALADLDASVKAEAINARRYKLQKQVSVGQQIFGAAPSSANPFLTPKRQSFAQYPSHSIAPSCMYSSNPFSSGDPTNPFLWFCPVSFAWICIFVESLFINYPVILFILLVNFSIEKIEIIYFWFHSESTVLRPTSHEKSSILVIPSRPILSSLLSSCFFVSYSRFCQYRQVSLQIESTSQLTSHWHAYT